MKLDAMLSVRISTSELRQLNALVAKANEVCRKSGIPATVTRNSMLRMWIQEHARAGRIK